MQLIQHRGDDHRCLLRTAGGRYLKMAPSVYHLLLSREGGATFDDIAAAMSRRDGNEAVQPDEVEQAYQKIVASLRIIEQQDSLTRSGFWLRWPLIPEALVNRLSAFLGTLFRPLPAAVLLVLIVMATAVFPRHAVTLDTSSENLFLGYFFLLVSLILHELGHASACAYFGARPRAIGFGVYLVYPVFYSDVSAAWELKRHQRVIVDLAGMFFQCGAGAIYVMLYIWLDWEPLLAATLMISGSLVFSLNPIFKFDGYWMIADALGVYNLSRQPSRVLSYFWQRLRGAQAEPLPWKPWVTAVLSVYSVLSFSVWGLFLWFVLPLFAERIGAYPGMVQAFLEALRTGQSGIVGDFFVSTYMFLLAGFIVVRMSRSWLGALGRLLHKWTHALRAALFGIADESGATS